MTPILNALSRAYIEFYTQNGREPDYFAMSSKMFPAFIEEASPVMRHPEPVYSTAAFRGIPIVDLPYVEGVVVACGDIVRSRLPFVIDSTTQGQEARWSKRSATSESLLGSSHGDARHADSNTRNWQASVSESTGNADAERSSTSTRSCSRTGSSFTAPSRPEVTGKRPGPQRS